ncbi:MAG: sugar phosphate isomerase/epimerase family protein [Promethearchaeota archaeon]
MMKLSIVSGLNESKSPQEKILNKFTELCSFLKSLDYDGIELSLLEPEKLDVKKINEIKDSYGLEISAIGTGSTYIRFGFSYGHQDEAIRRKAIERTEKYIDFARETGSLVIIGLIRGRYNYENNPKKEKSNIKISLKECVKIAENNNVILVFEPINSFEIDSFHTISEAIDLIDEIGSDNLKLLVDTFHVNLEEDPVLIWEYLGKITDYVKHIHLADTTRRAPGSGHFDFKNFLNIFKEHGYDRFVSIETIMKPSFKEVAKDSIEFLKIILK